MRSSDGVKAQNQDKPFNPHPGSGDSDQLLAAIVESSDDAILSKDLNGTITSWNKGAERLFGYSANEAINQPVHMLIPPDRYGEEAEILERVRQGDRLDHYETVRKRKDGSLVEVALTVSPIRDAQGRIIGASKVARDISDRKSAERARRLLSAIVESSDDAIASKDLNGILTSWNAGAERLLGYKASEVIGKHVTLLIPDDRLHEEAEIMARIGRGERLEHFHTMRRRKDGSLVDVSLTVSPIKDESGKVIGASKILRDITENVRMQEKLERLVAERTAQLSDMVAELEAFSYSVAHDMRAPLRAMTSYASILQEDYTAQLPPAAQDFVRRIGNASQRLDALITDVLNYSKISRSEMELGNVDIANTLREILESYPDLLKHASHITIAFPLPGVIANRAALTQCFSNLLTNAIKFVPAGRTPQVRVSAERNGEWVRIWVADNGIGISEEGRKRIFTMFQRLNPSSEFEGTGIGLTIVRKAVQRMGGNLGVESEVGVGSRFWIELKAAS